MVLSRLIMSVMFSLLSLTMVLAQDAPKGFRGDFLNQMKDAESKLMDLAQAMPDSSYGWRPMEGVRSVSEVYIHIAGANYLFPRFFGVKPPAGLEKDAEKTITEKSKVIDYMKKSFDHIRQAVLATSDDSLNNPTKMFGEETTYRGAIFTAATHMHEHLGQSIAYARSNRVVPPWTAAEQAAEKNSKK
jgi:uncharacterized damage-inducible protein DinB